MAQDLTRLVAKAQKGSETALNDLIVQCYDDLYYFAYKTVKNEDLAADITQESCIIILQKLHTLTQPGAFKSWARQVVYHQCTHYFRDSHEVTVEENEDGSTVFDTLVSTDTSSMPEEVAQDKAFQQIMQDLLNGLPAQQRAALMLYYYEKLSVSEIASIQGVSEGTIKSRLNYGRKAVKSKVEEYEKANDVRLHSAAFVPALLYFLFKISQGESTKAGIVTAPSIVAAAASTGAAAASTATTAGVSLAIVTGVVAMVGVVGSFFGGFMTPPESTETLLNSQPIISTTIVTTTQPSTSTVSTVATYSNLTTVPTSGTAPTQTQPTQPDNTDPSTPGQSGEGMEFDYQAASHSYAFAGPGTCTDTEFVIPSTYNGLPVTAIGERAFMNCTNLTSVVIPEGITELGLYAFRGCKGLTSITLPEGVTKIGRYAFQFCDGLTSIYIPDTVTTIDEGAFDSCALTSITLPGSVTTIGASAFSNCDNLTTVNIPNGVNTIGNDVFSNCDQLTTVSIPASVSSLQTDAFWFSSNLSTITVDSQNQHYVSIDNVVYTKDMKTLIFCANAKPDFYQVPNGVTTIASFAFHDCRKLSKVILPDSVTVIGDSAFGECINLAYLNIPDGVTTIGNSAFFHCAKLTEITIPAGVSSLTGSAFASCSGLTNLTVDSQNPYYTVVDGVLFTKDMTQLLYCTVAKTGTYTIPNTVTTIEKNAFGDSVLTNIIIPDSITVIGERVFYYCLNLTSVTIPASVTEIGKEVFDGCKNLTDIQFKGTMAQWNAITKGTSWNNGTGTYTIHCTDGDIPKA